MNIPLSEHLFTMLQSTLTGLVLASCNDSATLRDLGSLTSVILLISALLYRALYMPVASSPRKVHSPPSLQLPSWKVTQFFFEKRFDFIKDGFRATSSSIYQTRLFQHAAIILSGEEGRQVFFKEKGLCLYDTFSIMMGSVRSLLIDFVLNNNQLPAFRVLLNLIPIKSAVWSNEWLRSNDLIISRNVSICHS